MSFEGTVAAPTVVPAAAGTQVNPASQWDAADYTSVGSFVPAHGAFILESLAVQPGERVLDVGCGDGSLTAQLQESGARVVGIDASEALVAHARSRNLEVLLGDVLTMQFAEEFDAVFSNAVLHWVLDAPGAARAMWRALRPGGRMAVEFGGFGNIAAIRVALRVALGEAGYTSLPQDQFYPTARQYAAILGAAGFQNVSCEIVPRPTPLAAGLESWLRTFRGGLMNVLGIGAEARDRIFARTAELLAPSLLDPEGQWWADYVRIRAWAVRPEVAGPDGAQPAPAEDLAGDPPPPWVQGQPPDSEADAALVAAPGADGRWHVHEAAPAEQAPEDNPLSDLPPPTGSPQQPWSAYPPPPARQPTPPVPAPVRTFPPPRQ